MAKRKGSHYVKSQGKKPYLKKWEKFVLVAAVAAVALGVGIYFIVDAILNKPLPVMDGAVVAEDNWIIVNEGSSSKPKYFKYGAYDFAPLDVEIERDSVSKDPNYTGLYLRPTDGAYDYAFVYGVGKDPAELAKSVHANMPQLLENGDVHPVEPFEHGGRKGSIYWYTNWKYVLDEDGIPLTDASDEWLREYTQTFSCYMPAERGSLLVRVVYKGSDESAFVEPSVGFSQVGAIYDCITME